MTDAADRALIRERLNRLSDARAEQALLEASASACGALSIGGKMERSYLDETALSLLPRIREADGAPGLKGIFAPLEASAEPPAAEETFADGLPMPDAELRTLIAELQGCRYVSDQIAEIRRRVRSMRDLAEILSALDSEPLRAALMNLLDPREREILLRATNGDRTE